jgi:hypothetical protein
VYPQPPGYQPPYLTPQQRAEAEAAKDRRETRRMLGCAGIGCLAFGAVVAFVLLFVFLDHFGFVNDDVFKTLKRCRTFGC